MEEKLQELVVVQKKQEFEEKHSDLVLTDFEEEMKMLEDWLSNPSIDEGNCIIESKNPKDIIQFSAEEMNTSINFRWRYEEDMQQPVNNSSSRFQQQVCNNMYQLEDRLNKEIGELRVLIVKMSQRIHAKENQIYISRASGKLQMETRQQQDNKARKQQYKVWNPRGIQLMELMIRRA